VKIKQKRIIQNQIRATGALHLAAQEANCWQEQVTDLLRQRNQMKKELDEAKCEIKRLRAQIEGVDNVH
jgi:uncharacterized coiled-coil DUF342 family protein